MSEPISTTGSGFAAPYLYKILVYFVSPVAAAVVVMLMTPPKSAREWLVSFISTLACSFTLGARLVSHYFGIAGVADEMNALFAGGVFFLCGLPGWFLVRAIFAALEHYRNRNIIEILQDIREGKKHENK